MNIAILGGAYDPPHYGHLLAAEQVLDFTDVDEVWLMPCYSHAFDKKMSDSKHRLKMTKLCEKGNIKVSDFEIKQEKISYTFDTLNSLSEKYPKHKFSFLMGSSNVSEFKDWKNWQEILEKYRVLVFPRPGFEDEKLLKGMKLVKNKFLITNDLASTKIRERAKNNLNLKYFVSNKIVKYIKKHKLYR